MADLSRAEHIARAEELARRAAAQEGNPSRLPENRFPAMQALATLAQVHATLAGVLGQQAAEDATEADDGLPHRYIIDGQVWDLTATYIDRVGQMWAHLGYWQYDVPLIWRVNVHGEKTATAPEDFIEVARERDLTPVRGAA